MRTRRNGVQVGACADVEVTPESTSSSSRKHFEPSSPGRSQYHTYSRGPRQEDTRTASKEDEASKGQTEDRGALWWSANEAKRKTIEKPGSQITSLMGDLAQVEDRKKPKEREKPPPPPEASGPVDLQAKYQKSSPSQAGPTVQKPSQAGRDSTASTLSIASSGMHAPSGSETDRGRRDGSAMKQTEEDMPLTERSLGKPIRKPIRRHTEKECKKDTQVVIMEELRPEIREMLARRQAPELPAARDASVNRRVSVAVRHEVMGEEAVSRNVGRRVTLSLREENMEELRSQFNNLQKTDRGRDENRSSVLAELTELPAVRPSTAPGYISETEEESEAADISADLKNLQLVLRNIIPTGAEPVKPPRAKEVDGKKTKVDRKEMSGSVGSAKEGSCPRRKDGTIGSPSNRIGSPSQSGSTGSQLPKLVEQLQLLEGKGGEPAANNDAANRAAHRVTNLGSSSLQQELAILEMESVQSPCFSNSTSFSGNSVMSPTAAAAARGTVVPTNLGGMAWQQRRAERLFTR